MKTRYILIHCENELSPDTVFYTVWVGDSKRDKSDLQALQSLRFNNNFYFRQYDSEAAQFKMHCAESLFPGAFMPLMELKTSSITVHEARELVRTGYFGESYLPQGHIQFRSKFDVKFNARIAMLYGKGTVTQ